jgi:hypothetical protein
MYILMYMYTSVGRVSEIFDTCQIQFSQNYLQKGLVFTFSFFLKQLYVKTGYQLQKF